MVDVTIRRCIIRVVRRGGWSWGGEPRRLVNDIVRALPALLAAELQRLLPEDAEGEVAAPLRIDVRLALPDLRRWARAMASAKESESSPTDAESSAASFARSKGDIAEALRRALIGARIVERIAVVPPSRGQGDPTPPPPDADQRAMTLLSVLTGWQSAGSLESLLRSLPDAAVQSWHRVLFERPAPQQSTSAEEIPLDAQRLLGTLAEPAVDDSPLTRIRRRLVAAAELAADCGLPLTQPFVRAAIDRALANPLDALDASTDAIRTRSSPAGLRAECGFETRVSNALPFLLLGPLHQIGWLDVLEATMSGAHLEGTFPALAIALATKVLPEPERGWRRTPDAIRAAATFAGDSAARPDAEVPSLARLAAPLMPALDSVVRRSLIDGRRRGDPLLVCCADSIRLTVDPHGVFLVSHAEAHEDLAAHLLDGGSPAFIPEEDADARMLASLDAAGVTFVTPARPVRGERWTPVTGTRAPRLFSNRPAPGFVPPVETVAGRAREAWQAFACRPLPGRPVEAALDRSLSLAAALALGTIAWELWRSREATDPLLALERFGDLEGTVRFDLDHVRVRLPLGKRFRDLKDAGLLADIPRLPWLGFRSVVFAGG